MREIGGPVKSLAGSKSTAYLAAVKAGVAGATQVGVVGAALVGVVGAALASVAEATQAGAAFFAGRGHHRVVHLENAGMSHFR